MIVRLLRSGYPSVKLVRSYRMSGTAIAFLNIFTYHEHNLIADRTTESSIFTPEQVRVLEEATGYRSKDMSWANLCIIDPDSEETADET